MWKWLVEPKGRLVKFILIINGCKELEFSNTLSIIFIKLYWMTILIIFGQFYVSNSMPNYPQLVKDTENSQTISNGIAFSSTLVSETLLEHLHKPRSDKHVITLNSVQSSKKLLSISQFALNVLQFHVYTVDFRQYTCLRWCRQEHTRSNQNLTSPQILTKAEYIE